MVATKKNLATNSTGNVHSLQISASAPIAQWPENISSLTRYSRIEEKIRKIRRIQLSS